MNIDQQIERYYNSRANTENYVINNDLVCVECFKIVPYSHYHTDDEGDECCNICSNELVTKTGDEDDFGMLTMGEDDES